jgi:hypothetical protein
MIWGILGITFFILIFVFNKLETVYRKKYRETHNDTYYSAGESFGTLACASLIFSIIIIIPTSALFIMAHSYAEENRVQAMQDRHDAYVILLKENKDITVQNQLYKDIIEYNASLRKKKHYCNSLWTNLFFSKEWNDIEYIDIRSEIK